MSVYILDYNKGYRKIVFGEYPDTTLHIPQSSFTILKEAVGSLPHPTQYRDMILKVSFLHRSLEELLAVTEVLLSLGVHAKRIVLELAYLPYARDDKFSEEPYRAKLSSIYPNVLTLLGYKRTVIYDPHSPESVSRSIRSFGNIEVLPLTTFGEDLFSREVIIPDKGATSRALNYALLSKNTTLHQCSKERIDGKVTTTILPSGLISSPSNRFVIYDDICDGGNTFISIVKKLREYKPNADVVLCVSHGLFTGTNELYNYFTEVRYKNTLLQFPDSPITDTIRLTYYKDEHGDFIFNQTIYNTNQ